MKADEGSIVMGWLMKLVLMFGVLGFLAFDGAKVVVAEFGAADDASVAARAAADSFRVKKDVQLAYDAAVAALTDKPDDVVETESFQVQDDGTVDLVVTRVPGTLWLHKVGPLRRFAEVRQTGRAVSAP